MQIACPACKSKISVPDDKIKPEGTKVKCGKCSKIFTVKKKAAGEATQAKPAAPAAAAPAADEEAEKAPSMADELGLGRSSAPASDDESFFNGDGFGGEMDNYKTQLRPMGGTRDSSLFGGSEQLDHNTPAPKAAKTEDLFGSSDDLFQQDEEPAAPPPPRPAAAKPAPKTVMPPKESLDDLFGKGLDDDAHDDMANSLRETKPMRPAAAPAPARDTDDLFGAPDNAPAPKASAPPKAAPPPAASNLDDLFGETAPEPAPPPRSAPKAPPPPSAKGPSAEELAATLKLEPALKEDDLPKPPPPKPAEVKAAPAKKRELPVKAIALGVAVLALGGAVTAAVTVPAINQTVKQLMGQLGGMLESKPEVKPVVKLSFTTSVTAARLLTGGRGDSLYVVEGTVRNDYTGPRSFIKLRGQILGAGGAVLDTREVFAGNTLNDEEIRGLERTKIDGALNRAPGGGLRNFNVPAGAVIPFQIVFYDVAQPVEAQTVDPVGSEPGTE